MMLADMGADVIKIERNPGGDDTRRSVPPKIRGESAAFMMMNRNKRGLVLDLKTKGGAEVLRRLAVKADVLVENFGPGVMERLGFGYENLKQANPGLIYCSLSGFGRTGPYKDRRGFDLVAQAMSGIMSVTGDGPDSPPVKCGAAALRHHRRHHRRHGRARGLRAPAQDRQGPVGRDLALRGGAGADLLAVGDRARDRRRAPRDGLGSSAQRALSGVRSRRRLDRDRRREPAQLAQDRSTRSARPSSRATRASRTTRSAWPI